MPNPSKQRAELFSRPLLLSDALARLDELQQEDGLSTSVCNALRSTAVHAVRYALRHANGANGLLPEKEDVMDADIREILPILHVAARAAAKARGYKNPGDHENRAHRFVQAVTGERYDGPRKLIPCPEAWQPLVDAFPGNNGSGEFGYLARCCILHGEHRGPAVL